MKREDVLPLLNKYFKSAVLEKYPQAILNLHIAEVCEKMNKTNRRLGSKLRSRILTTIAERLRVLYGPWVNVYEPAVNLVECNFHSVYKTEMGRLYGFSPGTLMEKVFFTAHAFERFAERGMSSCNSEFIKIAFRRNLNTDANPADILKTLLIHVYQFCTDQQFMYLDVYEGILVLENVGSIFIVKTFLTYEMDFPKSDWSFTHNASSIMLNDRLKKEFWESNPTVYYGDWKKNKDMDYKFWDSFFSAQKRISTLHY